MNRHIQLRPLRLWQSLILFGVPAVLAALANYALWPAFESLGLSEENAWHLATLAFFVGLLVSAIVAYVLEGNPLSWGAFRERYRLHWIRGWQWAWTIGGLVVFLALGYASSLLALVVFDALGFVPPSLGPSGELANVPLAALTLLFNVLAEELWWRGFILPRQELVHGRYTWLLHGVLWACFHVFKWWAIPFMLLTTWIEPFLAQRLKNTTPGIIVHLVSNAVGFLPVVVALLGQ